MSDLGRLFRLRTTEWKEQLENFTTEALAIAIAHDFRPMKEALRHVDWSHDGQPDPRNSPIDVDAIVAIDATTQQTLWKEERAIGYLDLVLTLHVDGARAQEAWVEVKVNAWESGDQIRVYLEQSALRSPSPPVITLARTGISGHVAALKWTAIAQAIDTTHDVHSSWAALGEFLHEEQIASPPAPAHADKASCIDVIVEVNQCVRQLWPHPRIYWMRDSDLRNALNKSNPADLMTAAGPIWFGLKHKDGHWQWTLLVATVKNYEKIPVDPQEVLHAADIGGLSDQWVRHPESREVLQLVAPMDDDRVTDQDEIVAWFRQGLQELHDAGILDRFMAELQRRNGDQTEPVTADLKLPDHD